jgi:hypothetical protein
MEEGGRKLLQYLPTAYRGIFVTLNPQNVPRAANAITIGRAPKALNVRKCSAGPRIGGESCTAYKTELMMQTRSIFSLKIIQVISNYIKERKPPKDSINQACKLMTISHHIMGGGKGQQDLSSQHNISHIINVYICLQNPSLLFYQTLDMHNTQATIFPSLIC